MLTQSITFTPSPLVGEGWGEGDVQEERGYLPLSPTPPLCAPKFQLASQQDLCGSPTRGEGSLERDEALALEHADAATWTVVYAQAASLRDAHWGRTATYSRKVFVPVTNLCRDTCGYCTFVKQPGDPAAQVMSPEQVMAVVREGERLGCKEVLFSLGEKPELRYPMAREALARFGHISMIGYVAELCDRVLADTALIPHVNAGTLSPQEVALLKPRSGSLGLMLENVSLRLTRPGQAHHACPDKVPSYRLATLRAAGEQSVPFTTGILIGIGETWAERIDSLIAINALHRQYGHIQEVIVQNFRAKPGTRMAQCAEPPRDDMLKTLAVARLLLDADISLQAPPNLETDHIGYLSAGLNDWGGISPLTIDHINPERAWPAIDGLQRATNAAGFRLQERLTVYPRYLSAGAPWVPDAMQAPLARLARADGLAATQHLA